MSLSDVCAIAIGGAFGIAVGAPTTLVLGMNTGAMVAEAVEGFGVQPNFCIGTGAYFAGRALLYILDESPLFFQAMRVTAAVPSLFAAVYCADEILHANQREKTREKWNFRARVLALTAAAATACVASPLTALEAGWAVGVAAVKFAARLDRIQAAIKAKFSQQTLPQQRTRAFSQPRT